ncbi:terpene synthase family protein [Nonomuraea rubra]|uniref:terpene synthase family protein n=1 Tax=Nonomuraea rubra TaxID=46180 RepID=UPI0033ECA7E5
MNDPVSAYFDIRNDLADRLLEQSHQLAGVPEQDRGAVLEAALDAVPEVERLLRPYASLFADGNSAASRLAFSCLSAAATFPHARREQIADLGALSTILFGVDDITDNLAGDWTDRDIVVLFGDLASVLSGPPLPVDAGADAGAAGDAGARPVDEAMAAWQSWCARLHRYDGAGAYLPILRAQLERTGEAMARERVWATGGEPWPAYEEYLPHAAVTFLYHTWWLAALAICGPAPADAPAVWRSIEQVTDLGAACLRLANDVRTFQRERHEGKPNAVLILEGAGTSTEAAVERVTAHIRRLNAEFAEAIAGLPDGLAWVADGQYRCVTFSGGWYMARDTHAYTVRDLAADADAHRG